MQAMLGIEYAPTAPVLTVLRPMAKSRKPEITGPCPELARLVLEITGDVTRRQAEIHVGNLISHVAISRMWAGEKVTESTILRFAQGYRVDANPLLEAAGYPPLPTRQEPAPKTESGLESAGEIERVRDPEADGPNDEGRMKWIAAYDNLPLKIRTAMQAQIDAMLDEAYQGRKDIIGKRAE